MKVKGESTMISKWKIGVIFLVFLHVCIAYANDADEPAKLVKVTAEGVGAVINDDVARARDESLQDAYRRSIELAFGVDIQAETKMEMLQIVSDLVITKSKGYVKSFEIVKEGVEDDELYHTKIKAKVANGSIRGEADALKLLIKHLIGNPRVMIIVQEINIEQEEVFSTAASKLIKAFKAAGYHIIDKEQAEIIMDNEAANKAIAGDQKAAITIAASLKADVIIMGKVYTEALQSDTLSEAGMVAAEAKTNIKAIIARTGMVIVSKDASDKALHLSPRSAGTQAIEKCVSKIAEQLVYDVAAHLNDARVIKIAVENCSYSNRKKVIAALKTMRGVKGVYPRSFENSIATIEVKTFSTSEEVADRFDSMEDMPLEIKEVTLSTIKVKVNPDK